MRRSRVLQSTCSIAAHDAGVAAMDAKADLVVTAGYGGRQGRVVLEPHVKVISPVAVEASPAATSSPRSARDSLIEICEPGQPEPRLAHAERHSTAAGGDKVRWPGARRYLF